MQWGARLQQGGGTFRGISAARIMNSRMACRTVQKAIVNQAGGMSTTGMKGRREIKATADSVKQGFPGSWQQS